MYIYGNAEKRVTMYLMKKNNVVAKIEVQNHIPVSYIQIYDKQNLPIGSYSPYDSVCKLLLKRWIESRAIPATRPDLHLLEQKLGQTYTDIFYQSAGVSINDTFWFCENPESIRWEDINYHRNGFDTIMLALHINQFIQGLHSPDITTDGVMSKFWYVSCDMPYLAKIDKEKNGILAANEILFSNIATMLGIRTSLYKEMRCENIQACTCPGFVTDENSCYISAMQLKHEDMSRCGEKLLTYISNNLGFQKEIREMITLDCLFHNTDRHERNFGIIMNSQGDTEFAPLFDNGYCLGANHNEMVVSDMDMRLSPDSREDILSRYGIALDIDRRMFLAELQTVYEMFLIPEWQYEKAKMELETGMTLVQSNNKVYFSNISKETDDVVRE